MLTGMFIPIRAHSMPFPAWSGFGMAVYTGVSFWKSIFCCNRFNFGRFFRAWRICEVQILTSFFQKNRPNLSRGESAIPKNRHESD